MKYISLIVFTALLIWTWNVIHQDRPVSFETHSGIQEKLAVFITETIKAKRPNATEVIVEKIWTEIKSKNQVQAHFVYSYKEQDENGEWIANSIAGESVLERMDADETGNDVWKLIQVKANSNQLVFEEGMIVTSETSETTTETDGEANSESDTESGNATE